MEQCGSTQLVVDVAVAEINPSTINPPAIWDRFGIHDRSDRLVIFVAACSSTEPVNGDLAFWIAFCLQLPHNHPRRVYST